MPENSLEAPERHLVVGRCRELPGGHGESTDDANATLILAPDSFAAPIADLGAYKFER